MEFTKSYTIVFERFDKINMIVLVLFWKYGTSILKNLTKVHIKLYSTTYYSIKIWKLLMGRRVIADIIKQWEKGSRPHFHSAISSLYLVHHTRVKLQKKS